MLHLRKSLFIVLIMSVSLAFIGCDDEEGGLVTSDDSSDGTTADGTSGTDTSSSGTDTSSSGTDTSSSGTDTSSSGTDTSSSGTDTDTTCTPAVTCATEAAECGSITDDCGDTVDCGECGVGGQCNTTTNLCEPLVCVPTVTCATEAAECGSITDDCSQVIDCGTCETGFNCDGITQQCVADGTPFCGDGVINNTEACDDGANNSDADPDACRSDCTTARCGDGVADTGEDCDDGNAVNNDACTNLCGDSTHCDACVNADTCGVGNDCMSSFCAVPCDTSDADACPTDYTCADVSGTSYCVPDAGSCVPVTDPCDGFACTTPPATTCAADTLTTYAATGTCDSTSGAAVCSYAPTTTACAATETCNAAGTACEPVADPCSGFACTTPPAAACDGAILSTYAATGTCDSSSGTPSCDYARTTVDCAATGDICAAGACVPSGPVCDVTATDTGATADTTGGTSSFDPLDLCSDGGDGNDISFGWIAPTTGCYVIDTEGSAVSDTILAIFDDCDLTNGLDCDDDAGTGFLSSIRFDATAGTAYGIVVDGYGATDNGAITLNINACDPCDGFACATPPAATCATGSSITTYAATGTCDSTSGAPVCSYAPATAACATPPAATCAGNILTAYAAAGTCGGSPATCTYAPTTTDCAATPGNICSAGACIPSSGPVCNVTSIERNIGSVTGAAVATGTTVGAGNDHGTGSSCNATGTAPDVAIRWTAPADGCFTIDTVGSAFDTVLRLKSCATGSETACNDDFTGISPRSRLNLAAAASGQEYVFIVDGFGAASGNYTLNINACDPCATTTCNTPPAAMCPTNNSVTTYAATGTCSSTTGSAVCTYPPTTTTCNTPPATTCAADMLTTYAAAGTCGGSPSACSYAPTTTACGTGQTCNAAGTACVPGGGPVCDGPATATGTPASSGNTTSAGNDVLPARYAGCSTGGAGNDLVYSWTAPATGCFILDTEGSAVTDTVLAVFNDCALTSRLGCDDDAGTGNLSRVRFDATAGTTYAVAVDGYGASNNGAVNLNINACSPCEGVTCNTAPPADCATPSSVRTYTSSGTCDGTSGSAVCNYPSTTAACATPPAASCAGNILTTYAAGTCGGSPASCSYAPITTDCAATPGNICSAGACIPGSGPVCNVTSIERNIGSVTGAAVATGTTVGAGNDHGTGSSCNATGTAPDVAIRWTAPADGCFTIDTVGSAFDTVLRLKSCATGSETACNDDGTGISPRSRLNLAAAVTGEEYVFIVDGFGAASGNYTLNINACDPCVTTTCNTPPAAMCPTNNSVTTYAATGTCSSTTGSAVCTYPPTTTTCNTPPATTCAAGMLTTYAAAGTCGGSPSACSYAPTTTACSTGQTCNAAGTACVSPPIEVINGCPAPLCTSAPGTAPNTTVYTYTIPAGVHPVVNDTEASCFESTAARDLIVNLDTTGVTSLSASTCGGSTSADASVAVYNGSPTAGGTQLSCNEDRTASQFCGEVLDTAISSATTSVVIDEYGTGNFWNNTSSRTFTITVTNAPPAAEICDDTIDNDGDTFTDCADTDCAAAANCRTFSVGFCRLQFPDAITGNPGDANPATNTVYGRVYVAGLTDQSPANNTHPNLVAEFGFGPDGSNPNGNASWTWADAAPNPSYSAVAPEENNDEYQYLWTLPDAPGQHDYAYRFSGDGGANWTYCDGRPEGSSNGYAPADAGQATINGVVVPSNPFFSEYVEGGGNNKALEIYNPGATPLAAGACRINIYSNGSLTSGANAAINAAINPGDVHVICNSTSAGPLLSICDQTISGGALGFNGDDALELVCDLGAGPVTLDIIGQIGTDPGAEWGTGLTSTADNTLRRKCAVTSGDTNGSNAFDPSVEWDGFAVDTFSGLGTRGCP